MKQIGLIAGMGPEAGGDMLMRFLHACRDEIVKTGHPVSDQAYPAHVLIQYPIPDRSSALLNGGTSPLPGLVKAIGAAQATGADVFGIACNTAHFWHEDLQTLFPDIDLLHIATETAEHVVNSGSRRCAVLATSATQRLGMYASAFEKLGLEVVKQPQEDDESTHRAIFDIKAGNLEAARHWLNSSVERLLQSVDTVVLGCTELGLVVHEGDYRKHQVTDAATVLARALAAKAYGTYRPTPVNAL
ncbi:aspartate/glutamate racemase family protein [Ottowia thiooxydans]|uniref:aspartate/glutamate racemase family protein n=1 Tax=Ottowia thiooxydans TaxID=219182 RepID=UPI0006848C38|nr:amino acid racemase [Ottowia thiooxydans]